PDARSRRDAPVGPVVIDDFEDPSAWKAQPADGVELTLHPDSGLAGRSLRLDFRFVRGGGYAVIHRAVALDLPERYRFRFAVRGRCPDENLEFKLIDSSGENVWWSNQRDFHFPFAWDSVTLPKRRMGFAWGPAGGGDIRHVAAIEFAVTAGSGGAGSVWLDRLTLETLPPEEATPPKPVARASSSKPGTGAAAAVDGDPRTAWTPAATDPSPALTLDCGIEREFGALTLDWLPRHAPAAYVVETSDDTTHWRLVCEVRRGAAPEDRDRLYLPESETRWLRVRATEGIPADGVALAEITFAPLAVDASLNDFYAMIARDVRRGLYPRGMRGEPSRWAVVGADGDREEGLLSEDGALEVGKGRCSIEPFLWLDGRLVTWADVTTTPALVDGDLPLPSVTWHAKGLDLEIAVIPEGTPGHSSLLARYRLVATGRGHRKGTLDLAIRPFQVNPPSQFLNTTGGVARVDSLSFPRDHDTSLLVDRDRWVEAGSAPNAVGAVTIDEGDIVESWLARGRLPPGRTAHDPAGRASAAFAFRFDVTPAMPAEFVLDAALHPRPPLADTAGTRIAARWATRFAAARAEWRAKADRVRIVLPDSARDVMQTLKAQIGWILVNRDSVGIQPGSRAYERSWIRDGALTSSALLRLGHPDEVKAFLEWFAGFQYANGKIPCCVDRRGSDPVPEHDSHGEFIYLTAEVLRYTGDRALAERMWPHVAAAAAYLDTLRAQRLTPEWRAAGKEPFHGVLPPSISHEGYSAKPMHSYWDDLWALRGYKDAAYLAGALGHHQDHERLLATEASFARDFAASVRATMRDHAIPYVPGCADLGDFDPASTTIAFDPVQADTVLPAAAVDSTFERYWTSFRDRRDGRQDWDAFTPYEMRAIGAFVELGWRDRADSLLTWFMTQRQPAAWRQWSEVVWKDTRTARFIGDLPHTWVGSDFARSVLDMLAYRRERDDALVIAAGVPMRWARGTGVTVHGLPTPYGLLGYALRARTDRVEVDLEPGLRMPAGGIVVAPPGARSFKRALLDGAPARLDPGGRVTVWKVPAHVVFEY
ncbi:MAG: discoidin domain-containing protein, partial [Candidatus Eisenbacteria bacterium]